jgi:hypothetical protein
VREPDCVDAYLDTTARFGPFRAPAPSTYLDVIAHRRRRCGDLQALRDRFELLANAGRVVRLPAECSRWHLGDTVAYHRVGDVPWPLELTPQTWATAHRILTSGSGEPVTIDCALHGRRHRLSRHAFMGSLEEAWLVESQVAAMMTVLEDMRPETVRSMLTIAGPGDLARVATQPMPPLLADIARLIMEAPEPAPRWMSRHPFPHHSTVAIAAALLHARDCLHADAIIRAVEKELFATWRLDHTLHAAADPGWVTLRALEAAP